MKQDGISPKTSLGLVRDARPADANSVVQMVDKLAAHHGDTSVLTIGSLTRDAFCENPWIYILVAEADGMLVGYAALCNLIQLQFGTRGIDMHHLFVETSFRGRGVGESIVDACKTKAQALACGYLAVGTHPDNLKAQGFYEALGFKRGSNYPPRFFMRLEA